MTNPDTRVQQTLPIAVQLVGAVRDRDRHTIKQLLNDVDLPALAVTLAAMVDDDMRVSSLFAWTAYDVRISPLCDPALDNSPPGTQSVHGTRSRYNRGCRGAGCSQADREYQQVRYLREVAEGKRPGRRTELIAGKTLEEFFHEADPQPVAGVNPAAPRGVHRIEGAETPRHAEEPSASSGTVDDMQRQAS